MGQPGLIFSTLVLAPPGSDHEAFGFSLTEPRGVEVGIEHDGERIRLLGIHPLSPLTSERFQLRNAQMAWAADWAAETTGPALVVGDFNASQWSVAFRSLAATSGFVDSTRGFGWQPSFPMDRNPVIRVQIDHLLHSADLVTADRFLGPPGTSDHAPLVVDLALAR